MSEKYKIASLFIDFSMNGKRFVTIPNLWSNTKVSELKQRIKDKEGNIENLRLIYGSKQLENDDLTLGDYGICNEATLSAILRLNGGSQDPNSDKSRNISLTLRNELCPKLEVSKDLKCEADKSYAPRFDSCEEATYLKAKMSCGHSWCGGCVYYYLDKGVNTNGNSQVKCPISICYKPWNINETFVAANINNKTERMKYNRKMNEYGLKENKCSYCPKCETFIFKPENLNNRNDVQCPKCKFAFCFSCKNEWKNANMCKNNNCTGAAEIVKQLVNCKNIKLNGKDNVPILRRCVCGSMNEHNSGCKRMTCPCGHMYCQICNRRWSGTPLQSNCECDECNLLGESAGEACSYATTCDVVQN